MWDDVFLAALIGGLISLDRTAAFQVMLHRPLVAGSIIGWLLGQPVIGLLCGATLELIWINHLPLGGHIPPQECLSTAIVAASVILSGPTDGDIDYARIAFGFILAPPLARMGAILDGHVRRINRNWALRAREDVRKTRSDRLQLWNLAGSIISFVAGTAFILIGLPVALGLIHLVFDQLPDFVLRAFSLLFFLAPLVGVCVALSTIGVRRTSWVFGVIFLSVLMLLNI